MNIKLIDLLAGLDLIAPATLAESWDNVGLMIGDPQREVRSLLLGLDPTLSLLEEAISRGVDTLVTHHPCIFHPLPSVNLTTPVGAFLEQALVHKINIVACHTNFDSTEAGVSDALGMLLGLEDLSPLRPVDSSAKIGVGRIGSYHEPISFQAFMERAFTALGSQVVQLAGRAPQSVQRVALCGGSGSEFAEDAFRKGADVYLSSEIKHSTARWAEDAGFCVVDATHYATEKPAMVLLGKTLGTLATSRGWDIKIYQSIAEESAFTFMYKNNLSIE